MNKVQSDYTSEAETITRGQLGWHPIANSYVIFIDGSSYWPFRCLWMDLSSGVVYSPTTSIRVLPKGTTVTLKVGG